MWEMEIMSNNKKESQDCIFLGSLLGGDLRVMSAVLERFKYGYGRVGGIGNKWSRMISIKMKWG
jgi:hypothetical protein